ncbi:hypothetical protein JO375_15235 [Paenibacillus sp. UY79]|nr:hypothetical protein [Paenibacillus farraposensis]
MGKSTIIKLLLGLYSKYDGFIESKNVILFSGRPVD